MISGEIDLSVGQTFALAAFIVAWLAEDGVPVLLAVLIALAACALIGLINGVVTTVVGVSSFITTLGMFFFLNGLVLSLSNGRPLDTPGGDTYTKFIGGGAYSGILWAIGIALALQLVLMRTRWGLHTFAVGGNLLGSREAGINVRWVKTRNFMLAAVLAGFAGIIEAVRITSTDPLAGRREHHVRGDLGRRHRRHRAGRRQRHGDRRVHRRVRARDPARRLHAAGRQRVHVRPHPGPGDHRRDGARHLRPPGARARREGHVMSEVLRCENIAKRFGPVTALRDVSLHLEQGEVLGLLGDNGAGKSTLIKILCGYYKPDEGRILLDGEEVELHSVRDARSKGIDTVYQDLALINELSVFHNVFLNRELRYPPPLRLLNNGEMRRRAERYIARHRRRHPVGQDATSSGSPAASARRSRSRARCSRTRACCCSTSRWRRWASRRGRSSST